MLARAIAAGLSVAAGVAGGIITILLTNRWSWSWGVALISTTIIAIISQVWLSVSDQGHRVSAMGTGAVSAGGSINSDLDIEVTGSPIATPATTSSDGVQAVGNGVVAAGRNIKGRIRIRSQNK
jgi:hypothetical protein